MDNTQLAEKLAALKAELSALSEQAEAMSAQLATAATDVVGAHGADAAASGGHAGFFVTGITVFALACFVGYYVVWRVTPALHSPLMAVTNAVSSVIIVGALIAAGPAEFGFSQIMGFLAVILASVNIFGGFLVTQRMLSMFKKKGK